MTLRPPLAVLGGTFDPVHYGHLRLADDVRQGFGLTQVILLPAGDPPHRAGPVASGAERLQMLRLAVAEFPHIGIDDRELRRRGKSYTVLSLAELRAENPQRPLWLLLGADAFRGLPTWHRWQEIFAFAHLVVVERPGIDLYLDLPAPLQAQWNTRRTADPALLFSTLAGSIYVQPVTPYPISATAIRAQLKLPSHGRSGLAQLLPAAVLAYIDQHRLYRLPGCDSTNSRKLPLPP